jgi:glycosyltransferase involved in cell wall biosynthesis
MGINNPQLIKQIKLWQTDALLIYGWAYRSHLKIIHYFNGKLPIYFRGDSTLLDNKPGFKSILKTIFLKWVYSNVNHVFYTGTQNKAYFKKYGLKDCQLTFAPHAVDNDRFAKYSEQISTKFRSDLGINETDILILFAGKFEKKKSPEILLNAFNLLRKGNVHLLFVGNGKMEAMLKSKALLLENPNVHWLEFQNQSFMPAIYHACDLFCLPSSGPGESWGLAINEAMAAGRPIITSDKVGCAIDLVVPGVTGEIFTAGDVKNLYQNIRDLIDDSSKLLSYGDNARFTIANWNFSNQVKAILKIINPKDAG